MQHLFHRMDIIPMLFTEIWSSCRNLCPSMNKGCDLNVINKIPASLTLPINSMVAFRLEGGSERMSIDWGSVLYSHRLHAWPRCCRRSCCISPPWEFKGLTLWVLGHSLCMCPTIDNCNIECDFYHSPLVWIWLLLAVPWLWLLPCHWELGSLALVCWLFLLWPLVELIGSFVVIFEPL